MYSGPEISLNQLLKSREDRANRQRAWLSEKQLPLISFTINMVGPIKRNRIAEIAFELGCNEIQNICLSNSLSVKGRQVIRENTGYELLLNVKGITSEKLKQKMISIETEHPLGRLFDIDVIDIDGKAVSRDDFQFARRKCLVCGEEAKVCARSRAHSLQELIEKMCELVNDRE